MKTMPSTKIREAYSHDLRQMLTSDQTDLPKDSIRIELAIRATIPSAMGFMTKTAAQSRVAIDENGCELLLGKGDCLLKVNGEITRVHGAMITGQHLARIAV
ncbi:hypothetical protein VSS37_03950 [Candidatus Thiothrix sp. Deng01]|uniref:Flagellar motor switch protein FliN-like C-terminal domain-containing protein n=1 Tax=Candidatus Thiothrix phosphatis TaxID=3112415 RepID=A0ABU6CTG8_9GAMM|nr:hypothetical protein [Candidatus Thiothrix sp. Deng01]MEB4590125.1 hypothetical protein [Candidatus Thiothrix sp. Deng01]